jgi:ribosomal protein L34
MRGACHNATQASHAPTGHALEACYNPPFASGPQVAPFPKATLAPFPNPPSSPRSGVRLMALHYPRRVSKIKRVRQFGFRARMRTRLGRKMISAKRRLGRRISVK